MIAANHALTGAAIGLAVQQPLLAVPLAVASHFVLDALPHFSSQRMPTSSRAFLYYLAADAGICGAIVLTLAILQPQFWLLACICAFAAASPDFMWAKEFLSAQNGQKPKPRTNLLMKLHSKVQWYQKEPGIIVEIIWAGLMLVSLAKLVVIW